MIDFSPLVIIMMMLSASAILGLWIGGISIRGVSLGIGGVLFGGIIVGHVLGIWGIHLDLQILGFLQEFGLILFVYAIGIQVGPGFFSSLRVKGLQNNGLAVLSLVVSLLTAALIHWLAGLSLPVTLGILSGAVTNTPSFGAGVEMLQGLGFEGGAMAMGTGYAMAYPFAIAGILAVMWLSRIFLKVNIGEESRRARVDQGRDQERLHSVDLVVKNENLDGLYFREIPLFQEKDIVCTRILHEGVVEVPNADTRITLGDWLHIVGDAADLSSVKMLIGEEVEDAKLMNQPKSLSMARIVVTSEKAMGKRLSRLALRRDYGVAISRIHRAGVELVPSADTHLQFGDVLNIVGRSESIEAVSGILGNAEHKLRQVQMLPVFIGIILGVFVGSLPLYVPGLPVPLKLGLAGGPLVVALILGRIGTIGKFTWFMPPSGNLALRELGIVLFLSIVGLKSGGTFWETLVSGDGVVWASYGFMITTIPLIITALVGRHLVKLDYFSLCGVLAGSMTDPPALAFANDMDPESGAAALAYTNVYPLTMFLRILTIQILALLLYSFV